MLTERYRGTLMPNVILAEPVQTFVLFWRNQHDCTVVPDLGYAIARRRKNRMYKKDKTSNKIISTFKTLYVH